MQSELWKSASSLECLALKKLVPDLLELQLNARAPNTVRKYRAGWSRWHAWASSGAASNPGCRKIASDLLDKHAGWKCSSSKLRYIKYSVEDLLGVSRALGI